MINNNRENGKMGKWEMTPVELMVCHDRSTNTQQPRWTLQKEMECLLIASFASTNICIF